jgi:hypothetical protein
MLHINLLVSSSQFNFFQKSFLYNNRLTKILILSFSVFLKNMRVTRWIVLPLLAKTLCKFGCFEGILQKAKLALLLFY